MKHKPDLEAPLFVPVLNTRRVVIISGVIDREFSPSAILQCNERNKEQYATFGVLEWGPGDTVLQARSAG